MIQTVPNLLTFEEFLDWKPENGRYELHNGVIVEMQQAVARELNLDYIPFLPYLIC